jgi:hypothetical protein
VHPAGGTAQSPIIGDCGSIQCKACRAPTPSIFNWCSERTPPQMRAASEVATDAVPVRRAEPVSLVSGSGTKAGAGPQGMGQVHQLMGAPAALRPVAERRRHGQKYTWCSMFICNSETNKWSRERPRMPSQRTRWRQMDVPYIPGTAREYK